MGAEKALERARGLSANAQGLAGRETHFIPAARAALRMGPPFLPRSIMTGVSMALQRIAVSSGRSGQECLAGKLPPMARVWDCPSEEGTAGGRQVVPGRILSQTCP